MPGGEELEGSSEAVTEPSGMTAGGAFHSGFLSYASADAGTANSVCAFLEAHGVECWMAPRDVKPRVATHPRRPDRREAIALRCPCCAQARGGCEKNFLFFTLRPTSVRVHLEVWRDARGKELYCQGVKRSRAQ
jgi:hypothetical protein